MKRSILMVFILLLSLLAACTAALPAEPMENRTLIPILPGGLTQTVSVEQPAVIAARNALAVSRGIDAATIQLIGMDPVDWTNSCLEVQVTGQACEQVMTPGYRLIFDISGEQVEYRTNLAGEVVMEAKLESQGSLPNAVLLTRVQASETWLIPAEQFQLIHLDEVEWSNGCLGVEKPEVGCTDAIVPGYRIILEAQGYRYEYHTDLLGDVIVEAAAQQPTLGDPQLVWQGGEEECRIAHINERGMDYGSCEGILTVVLFNEPQRSVELLNLLNSYTTFTAQTSTGLVEFMGKVQELASPVEQRAVAEWAAAIVSSYLDFDQEAGIVFQWKRKGGIAGLCDELVVFASGFAEASSCKGNDGSLGKFRLSSGQLEIMYGWLDHFESFTYEESDQAVADAMTRLVKFNGRGVVEATQADRAAILLMADDLFSQIP